MANAALTERAPLAWGDATRRRAEEARIALWSESSPLGGPGRLPTWSVQKEKPCAAKSAVRWVTYSLSSRAEETKRKEACSLFIKRRGTDTHCLPVIGWKCRPPFS